MGAFDDAVARLRPVDAGAAAEAAARHDRLTKPAGSLGRLESAGIALCAIARRVPPPVPAPATVVVFAADHGVLAQGVSPWPAEVTAAMVANFLGGGAAVNVLARHAGCEVLVVDVGVASELPELPELSELSEADAGSGPSRLRRAKIRPGTRDLCVEDAMTESEARAALDVGAAIASDLVGAGNACLLTGDMGIGNTTPAAALIGAFCGRRAEEVTGRGTGIDDDRLALKVKVVSSALERLGPGVGAVETLAAVGGLEFAALAGYMVGGAAAGVPVILDGVIAVASALVARALAPDVACYLVAGHRSSEPGASIGLEALGLQPLVDLSLRLGEGTGACLALPILQAAARILAEMATFDEAGVSDAHD